MNYYERYVGDYQRDTAHLSLAEHGAYTMLLDTYYATENALPADYPSLCRICRAYGPNEQKAVKSVANQFFPVGQDGLRHNAKADVIIPKALKRIQTASENGKNGGRPPKQVTEPKPTGLFEDNPVGYQNETQPQSSPTPTKDKEHSSEKSDMPEGFAEFWEAWPKTDRKTAKSECAKKWKSRGLSCKADLIVADVERRKSEDRQWLGGFEPAPLTYINQKRWEDVDSGGGSNPFV
jgi:uncharacterized protein YdaU (DUF1376 family)